MSLEEREQRGVEFGRLVHRPEMPGAIQQPELGAGDFCRHSLHGRSRRDLVLATGKNERRHLDSRQVGSTIEGSKQVHGLAIGIRRNPGHDALGVGESSGVGARGAHRGDEARRHLRHRLSFVQGSDARLHEILRERCAAAERGAGERKRERFHELRMPQVRFLRNESAHAVADDYHRAIVQVRDQSRERRRHLLEIVRLDDRALAVARLVPGMRAESMRGEKGQLRVPRVMAAADAVQEDERGQASAPVSFPSSTTGVSSSRIVQRRSGKS